MSQIYKESQYFIDTNKAILNELRRKVKTKTNKYKISAKELEECPTIFFDLIKEVLESGDKIQFSGFGSFRVVKRKRTKIKSIDGNEVFTDPLKNIIFKQSKKLEKKINKIDCEENNE